MDNRKQNTQEAREQIKPHLGRIHSIIIGALKNDELVCKIHDEVGLTPEEIASQTALEYHQIHKRMSELEKMGKVYPDGKRKGFSGRNQTVWKLTKQA